jgi:hypothetical protein
MPIRINEIAPNNPDKRGETPVVVVLGHSLDRLKIEVWNSGERLGRIVPNSGTNTKALLNMVFFNRHIFLTVTGSHFFFPHLFFIV